MQGDEARVLLGFPPNSRPSSSQIKAAYKKKVWESHPDLFPTHKKPCAESKFKLVGARGRAQGTERNRERIPDDFVSFDSFTVEGILDDWLVEGEKQAIQDEEILYSEMEHLYGDEMDENDPQENRAGDMMTLTSVVEPLEVNPTEGITTDDDDGLDFLDDD